MAPASLSKWGNSFAPARQQNYKCSHHITPNRIILRYPLTAPGADRWSRLPGRARWWPPGPRGWRAPCRRRHRSRAVPPLRRSRRRGRLGRWGLRTPPATGGDQKSSHLRWKNWWKIVPCDVFDDSLGLFLYACVYCVCNYIVQLWCVYLLESIVAERGRYEEPVASIRSSKKWVMAEVTPPTRWCPAVIT